MPATSLRPLPREIWKRDECSASRTAHRGNAALNAPSTSTEMEISTLETSTKMLNQVTEANLKKTIANLTKAMESLTKKLEEERKNKNKYVDLNSNPKFELPMKNIFNHCTTRSPSQPIVQNLKAFRTTELLMLTRDRANIQ